MESENNNWENKSQESKNTLYYVIAILAITSIAYRFIYDYNFERTSILFVGLPALITVLIVRYSPTPESAYGVVFKTITIFLLMSSILLGEGTICILLAAPIFYAVGAIIVFINKYIKERNNSKLNIILLLPLILLLGQPSDYNSLPSAQSVKSELIFDHIVSLDMLQKTPDLAANLPFFLTLGFPRPIDSKGTGIELRDERYFEFESKIEGQGKLMLSVAEISDSTIVFKPVSDNSHIGQWIKWDSVTISVTTSSDEGKSIVVWESAYTCLLGPSWYFEPWEKLAVKLMNQHLIRAYFG